MGRNGSTKPQCIWSKRGGHARLRYLAAEESGSGVGFTRSSRHRYRESWRTYSRPATTTCLNRSELYGLKPSNCFCLKVRSALYTRRNWLSSEIGNGRKIEN